MVLPDNLTVDGAIPGNGILPPSPLVSPTPPPLVQHSPPVPAPS